MSRIEDLKKKIADEKIPAKKEALEAQLEKLELAESNDYKKVDAKEKNDVCVMLQDPEYDSETGQKKFPPYKQYFNPTAWRQFLNTYILPEKLEVVEVLNMPTKGDPSPKAAFDKAKKIIKANSDARDKALKAIEAKRKEEQERRKFFEI